MKVYISTPINARREATFALKYEAARQRVEHIVAVLRDERLYEDAQFVSTFNFNPIGTPEAQAMGRCVQAVLECDTVFLDSEWCISKGCELEYKVANLYGKERICAGYFDQLKDYDPFKPVSTL